MKFIIALMITVAIMPQEQLGIMGAMAAGMEPRLSPRKISSLLDSSRISFQDFKRSQSLANHRRLEDRDTPTCDETLLKCLLSDKCSNCVRAMGDKNIDFTTLAHGTNCDEVIDPLIEKDICSSDIKTDKLAKDAFCATVDSCTVKEKNDGEYYDDDDDAVDDNGGTEIDCDALTECNWDGFKAGYIGDGACHNWGCYNTAICKFDGGDCCVDTCKDADNGLVKCGSDGYGCRDPSSDEKKAADKDKDKEKEKSDKRCESGETGVLLHKFASFGNGWGKASMTINKKGSSTKKGQLYEGTMDEGATSKELICFPNEPACYDVKLSGGIWGNRVSWQIKPLNEGGPEIASGGAPLECEFPMGGDECDSTCNGQIDSDSTAGAGGVDDDDFDSYKTMESCIESTCLIQLASCELSKNCQPCMNQENPYCYSDPSFMALVKCTLCNCVPDAGENDKEDFETYCAVPNQKDNDTGGDMAECTADESRKGIFSLFNYTICSSVDFETVTLTDYDNDHFGRLDSFETCVNTYTNEEYHGGNTALGCMRILQEAIKNPTEADQKNDPSGTIAKMAYHLYEDAETFCDCSAKTSESCPACKGFKNFKTILYESLDACRALDQIDCAAWSEFSSPCQAKMESKFGNADFRTDEQCRFAHEGCGGVGPFPSFRHLDCETESGDKEAWHFYETYAAGCLKEDGSNPSSKPGNKGDKPVTPKTNPDPRPAPKTKSVTAPPTKRYVPDYDDGSSSVPDTKANKSSGSTSSDDGKSGGSKFKSFMKFILFCILCGGGYWYYKRTREFDYVRFRRARNYGADSGMYDGSAMENSATSFEPPSLPPPPSSFQVNNNFA